MLKLTKYLIISTLAVGALANAWDNQGNNSYGNDQGYGYQGYGNQGYGNQGYGNQGYGNQAYGYENQGNNDQYQTSSGYDTSSSKNQNVPDAMISQMVMRNLRSTPYLSSSARSINVTTKDGKVTLKGQVANSNEKNMIEYMVKNVDGVKSVSNDLKTEK